MLHSGLYNETVTAVRRAGAPILPCFYGQNFGPVTDQLTLEIIPAVDRGPFCITSIDGLPFDQCTLTRSDRVQLRVGGNDLSFAPFLASGLSNSAVARGVNQTLPCPILVAPGSSLFIRNTVEGAVGVAASGQVTVSGFHTSNVGAHTIARYGQPWVIPITHDHNTTGLTIMQTDRQFQNGVVEFVSLCPGFNTVPDVFNVRFRGVEVVEGAQILINPADLNNPIAQGAAFYAAANENDNVVIKTIYTAPANQKYAANLWTRRVYQGGASGC